METLFISQPATPNKLTYTVNSTRFGGMRSYSTEFETAGQLEREIEELAKAPEVVYFVAEFENGDIVETTNSTGLAEKIAEIKPEIATDTVYIHFSKKNGVSSLLISFTYNSFSIWEGDHFLTEYQNCDDFFRRIGKEPYPFLHDLDFRYNEDKERAISIIEVNLKEGFGLIGYDYIWGIE